MQLTYSKRYGIYYSHDKNFLFGWSTKAYGDGREKKKLQQFLQEQNVQVRKIVEPNQQHTNTVYEISPFTLFGRNDHVTEVALPSYAQTHNTNFPSFRAERGIWEIDSTDGLVTSQSKVVLTVVTADCAPIFFWTEINMKIAIAHAGWKGTFHNINTELVRLLEEDPYKIHVLVGPTIRSCCYELYGERLQKFSTNFPHTKSIKSVGEKRFLDIPALNKEQLIELGLREENIHIMDVCTSCNINEYFSYHRDGNLQGEMVSFIAKIK